MLPPCSESGVVPPQSKEPLLHPPIMVPMLVGYANVAASHASPKDRFAKPHPNTGTSQSGGFHRRLRDGESYAEKWQYVRQNRCEQDWWSARRSGPTSDACMRFVGREINLGGAAATALPAN